MIIIMIMIIVEPFAPVNTLEYGRATPDYLAGIVLPGAHLPYHVIEAASFQHGSVFMYESVRAYQPASVQNSDGAPLNGGRREREDGVCGEGRMGGEWW